MTFIEGSQFDMHVQQVLLKLLVVCWVDSLPVIVQSSLVNILTTVSTKLTLTGLFFVCVPKTTFLMNYPVGLLSWHLVYLR